MSNNPQTPGIFIEQVKVMEYVKSSGDSGHFNGVSLPSKSKYFPPSESLNLFVNISIWAGWGIAALTAWFVNDGSSMAAKIGTNIAIWWALGRISYGIYAFKDLRHSLGIVHEGLLHVACHLGAWFFYFMALFHGFKSIFSIFASGGRIDCVTGGRLLHYYYASHGNPCGQTGPGGWMLLALILTCLNARGVYEVSLRRGEISKIREAKAAELLRIKYEYPYIGDKGEILDLSQVDAEKALTSDDIDGVRKAMGIDNVDVDQKPH